jgi:hypothetical protein
MMPGLAYSTAQNGSNSHSVVRPATTMRVNNGIIMRDSALQGLGIALVATFVVQECVTSGGLRMLDVV